MANPFSGGVGGSFNATAASPPSYAGQTITQQAYGTAPNSTGPKTAFLGTTISGVAGVLVLLYLYSSLPR